MARKRRGSKLIIPINMPQGLMWPVAFAVGVMVGYLSLPSSSKDITLAPSSVRVCFTPGRNCESEIISLISQARKEILVQAYAFTSENIGNALIDAHQRGVATSIIYDKKAAKESYSQIPRLKSLGIKTIPDNVRGLSHNKCLILDRAIIVTGSYNWTLSANNKNAENVVMFFNPELANEYVDNWMIRKGRD